MTISKVQLLNDTGVTAGSYNLSSITVGADGRISAASTPGSIEILGTAVGDGDIRSVGGNDGQFGLFNQNSTSPTRNITLSLRSDGDVNVSRFYVGRVNALTEQYVVEVGNNFSAAFDSYKISDGTGYTWRDQGDVTVNGGTDGTWGMLLDSNTTNRSIGFYIYNDNGPGNEFAILGMGRNESNGHYYVSINQPGNPVGGTELNVDGNVSILGTLSKAGGSFSIEHPIDSTKKLIHSFVEGPRADLIYRGTVTLNAGSATVNLDENYGLIPGTWNALCRNPQVWVTSDTGWTQCKGSVDGGVLTITAKTSTCTETVSWLVIAERQDKYMFDAEWTDKQGRPILEPDKSPAQPG